MDNQKSNTRSATADWTVAGIVIRLIASAVDLAITAFLVPEFSISGIGPLVIAAIVLTVMDYLFVKLLGIEASPFGRGIVGFGIRQTGGFCFATDTIRGTKFWR